MTMHHPRLATKHFEIPYKMGCDPLCSQPAAGRQTWKRLSASPLSAELFLSDGVKLNPYRSVCSYPNVLKTEKEMCTPCTASIVQMRTGKRIHDTAKHTTVYPKTSFIHLLYSLAVAELFVYSSYLAKL
ncbi:hypothetical protein COCON_G00147100 [Conger conger]|uniref:Uncharacterized protein n=1 Tax=Conger conger TaxID=82655 RepID=A0A9Q1HWA1_CONCO|nr:hypothetical protein COCON_G00147100 [Conger conger]